MNIRTWLLVLLIPWPDVHLRAGDVDSAELAVRQLTEVIEWEILWEQTPSGFRVPANRTVKIAMYLKSDSVSYCSHLLGVCAHYRTEGFRNWEEDRNGVCQDSRSDEDCLLAFATGSVQRPGDQQDRRMPVLGPGSLTGQLVSGTGIQLTTEIRIRRRAEIMRRYRETRPTELRGLLRWLGSELAPSGGYKSITVACFLSSDPVVYAYGDRPQKSPVVFAVFWDRELNTWTDAALYEGPQAQNDIKRLKGIIDVIPCATIR